MNFFWRKFPMGSAVILMGGLVQGVVSFFASAAASVSCALPFYVGGISYEIAMLRESRSRRGSTVSAEKHPALSVIIAKAFEAEDERIERIEFFRGEAQCYVGLKRFVEGVDTGASYSAVCFNKTWEDNPALEAYFEANIRAVADRKIRIHRIFADGQLETILPVAKRQRAAGIRVQFVAADTLERIANEFGLPRTMGFAVSQNCVFFHVGVGESAEGFLVRSASVVRLAEILFEQIASVSRDAASIGCI